MAAGLATAFLVVAGCARLLYGLPLPVTIPLSGAGGAVAAITLSNFLTARLIRDAVATELLERGAG